MRVLRENLLVQFSLVYLVIIITFGLVISATSGGMLNTMMAEHMIMMPSPADQTQISEDINHFRWFNLGILAASFTALYSGLVFIVWQGSGTFTRERSRMGAFSTELERKLQERIEEVATVDKISRIVTSTLDIDDVYESFALETKKLVDFDRAAINTINHENNTFTVRYIYGPMVAELPLGTPKSLNGTYIEKICETGMSIRRTNFEDMIQPDADSKWEAIGPRSSIMVPLISKGCVIGTFALRSSQLNAYGPHAQDVLERLAKQIAPAIENAILFEQVQAGIEERAVVDEVARIITSTLDIGQVFDKFAIEVKKLVNFDRVVVNSINMAAGTRTLKYIYGELGSAFEIGSVRPLEGTQNQQVAMTRQTLVRSDFASRQEFQSDVRTAKLGLKSSIMVPLLSQGEVIGTLGLRSGTTDGFGEREQEILERLATQIAPALENAILFEQVQVGIEEKAVVDEVARIITSNLNIDDVYERFALEVKKLVDFDRAAINTINNDDDTFTVRYIYGPTNVARPLGTPIPLTGTQMNETVDTKKTIKRVNIVDEPKFSIDAEWAAMGLKSVITVPLISKGTVIGIFALHSNRSDAYGLREQEILERLAQQIAPAVENTGLYEQVQTSTAEKMVVDEVARVITSTLNIEEVYQRFALEMKKLVDFDRAAINTINHDDQTFTVRYVYGSIGPMPSVGTPIPLGTTQVGEVVRTANSSRRSDIPSELRYRLDDEWVAMGLKSGIMVPLISKGEVIGTFGLRSRLSGAYGPHDQNVLERLATQIAPAIENAILFEQVQTGIKEKAVVDEVARIITSTLEIDQVFDKFAEAMKRLVDFDRIAFNIVDGERNTFESKHAFGPVKLGNQQTQLGSLEGTQTQRVLTSGEMVVRDNIQDPPFAEDQKYLDAGLMSSVLVPLIFHGRKIGAMGLRSKSVGAYGTHAQQILKLVAAQISPAMANAKLYKLATDAERELSKLSRAVEQSSSGVMIADYQGKIEYANPKFSEITGYSLDEVVGENPRLLKSDQTPPEDYQRLWETISSGKEWHGEFLNQKKNGQLYWASGSISPIRSPEGEITHYVAVQEDVTERKLLEEQLLQSQKMETVGRLAGGVAHDFNNLLTAIIGYSQMAKAKALPGEDIDNYLHEAINAAERASKLTSQLLAFARKQHVEPQVLNLNDLVLNLDKMLRRLISEDIELAIIPGAKLASIKADPLQLEQVLMNLVVNARDAMAEGGRIAIETNNHNLDEAKTWQDSHRSSGQCVVLTISDSGSGMSQEVKSRLFEPFFTTKSVGEGTGLGLSTCYGIVDQIGGFIEVESELGQGAAFKVHIPVTEESPVTLSLNQDIAEFPRGSETILLAEDEPAVRSMVGLTLREQGYEVLEAINGDEALRLSSNESRTIHALVTDVIMPGIGGPELAERLCAARPNLKVLFTSGYSEGINSPCRNLPANAAFLQKPYMPDALARKMREVLDH